MRLSKTTTTTKSVVDDQSRLGDTMSTDADGTDDTANDGDSNASGADSSSLFVGAFDKVAFFGLLVGLMLLCCLLVVTILFVVRARMRRAGQRAGVKPVVVATSVASIRTLDRAFDSTRMMDAAAVSVLSSSSQSTTPVKCAPYDVALRKGIAPPSSAIYENVAVSRIYEEADAPLDC